MPDFDDAVSTLVLVNDEEYVLRASRGRVLFDRYSHEEASREQAITLTLVNRNADSTPSTESAAVPIILSPPGTPRFELSTIDEESSPLEFLLLPSSLRTFTVKFKHPELCESDYAWDNFQDQIVVHTRLSKLVVHLEAWKDNVPSELAHDRRNHLMFPANLPDVKAPPLKRFGVIEGNGGQRSTTQLQHAFTHSRENLATASLKSTDQPTVSVVATIQSLREAREVILKLRCRRRLQSTTKAMNETSPASVSDRELFPETTALDADTKAELNEFNDIVVAARNQAKKAAAKAKRELEFYQQLVPVPPRDCALEMATTSLVGSTSVGRRKAWQMSAASRRPSRLPALVRPSSGAPSSSITPASSCSATNQETAVLDQESRMQRVVRSAKPKSLSICLVNNLQSKSPAGSKLRGRSGNQQHAKHQDAPSELSDFDDSDPEVDEAPLLPDDLSGVATLDADDV